MNDVLAEATELLDKPVPDNWPDAWHQILDLDHIRYPLGQARITAIEELSKRRLQVLHPKDSSVTDLDRTTILEAGSAEQKALVEKLTLMMDLIVDRIELLRAQVAMLGGPDHTETKEV